MRDSMIMVGKNLWDWGQSNTQEKMYRPNYIDSKAIKMVNKLSKHSMEDTTKRWQKQPLKVD